MSTLWCDRVLRECRAKYVLKSVLFINFWPQVKAYFSNFFLSFSLASSISILCCLETLNLCSNCSRNSLSLSFGSSVVSILACVENWNNECIIAETWNQEAHLETLIFARSNGATRNMDICTKYCEIRDGRLTYLWWKDRADYSQLK